MAQNWARMSEDWLAEETGIRPKRKVSIPEPVIYDENAMEVDEDMDLVNVSYADHKPAGDDSQPNEDLGGGYAVHVKYDPRPTICYDEVVERSPPRFPREVTKRFKVHVDFDDDRQSKPSIKSRLGGIQSQAMREAVVPSPTSIKNRLGGGVVVKREDGEVSEEDSDDDNIKDNLEGHAWTKKLIGPRMRMYADEEFDKKKKQDSKTKLYKDKFDSHSHHERSHNQLKRIQPSGIQLEKTHRMPRKPKAYENDDDDEGRVSRRLQHYKNYDNRSSSRRNHYENHDDRSNGVFRNHGDDRSTGVSRRNGHFEREDVGSRSRIHRYEEDGDDEEDDRSSRRIPIKDRLGSRIDRVRR